MFLDDAGREADNCWTSTAFIKIVATHMIVMFKAR